MKGRIVLLNDATHTQSQFVPLFHGLRNHRNEVPTSRERTKDRRPLPCPFVAQNEFGTKNTGTRPFGII